MRKTNSLSISRRKTRNALCLFIFSVFLLTASNFSDRNQLVNNNFQNDIIGNNEDIKTPVSSSSEFMNFQFYKIIIIEADQISGTQILENFPVVISIYDSDLYSDVQSDGDDIAFAIDNKWLDHEIEFFDRNYNSTHAHLIAWIRIPNLKPKIDNKIYMYYGNLTMGSSQNPSGIWNNYKGVWHLNESTGSGSYITDSTGNGHDGTPLGTSYRDVAKIGGARYFGRTGSNGIIMDSSSSIFNGDSIFSFSFWIYPNYTSDSDWETNSEGRVFTKSNSIRLARLFRQSYFPAGQGNFQADIQFANDGTTYFNSQIYRQEWSFITVSYDGSDLRMFINGLQTASTYIGNDNLISDTSNFGLGGTNYIFGLLDEFRVSNIQAPTLDWAITEYNNQLDPDSFIQIGEEQTVSVIPFDFGMFGYSKNITILSSQVAGSGTLEDFPLMFSIYDSDLQTKTQSNGNDIAFSINNLWLDHEIETFEHDFNSTHAQLIAWIRIPSLSATIDTKFIMSYGNSTIGPQENPIGVWNGNYQGIWHMNSYHPTDSTYNQYDGTAHASMTPSNQIQSQIGTGIDFDGSNDFIDMGDVLRPESEITLSAWIKADTLTSSTESYVIDRSNAGTGIDYGMAFETDDIRFVFYDSAMDGHGSDTFVETGVWQYFTITKVAGGYLRYYDDGVEVDSTTSGTLAENGSTNFILGARYTGTSNFFNGIIDEVRVSNSIRSADWIQTEYNNQFNPSNFISVGGENDKFVKLTIQCLDYEGFPFSGLNITLFNQTDPYTWDNSISNNQFTNDTGWVEFDRIQKEDYTITVTYGEKYNNPIQIKQVNIHLNDSYDIIFDDLNLTTMDLTFVYEGTSEPFYNGKVSFFEDDGTNNPNYIGYEISDEDGNVSFSWLNRSKNEMNYTITVEKLGNLQPLNSTVLTNITVTMENYSEYIIEVSFLQTEPYSTYLSLVNDTKVLMNTFYWGENFSINVSYGYEEYPDENTTIKYPILDASVSFQLLLNDVLVNSGSFDHNGSGGYGLDIDPQSMDIQAMGNSYILEIIAFKPGYDDLSRSIIIELLDVPMEMNPENDIDYFDFYWLESMLLSIQLNDTYNSELINDAEISYVDKWDENIDGTLQRDENKGDGWYNITINSMGFSGHGSYTLEISAVKNNYVGLVLEIYINILPVPMDILLENGINSHEIYWLDNLTINIQLWDDYYSNWINDGNLTFEEQRNGYISGNLQRNSTKGDGWYTCIIISEELPIYGGYTISISSTKENYIDFSKEIYINILQINTLINGTIFLPLNFEMSVTTKHSFFFNYTDSSGKIVIGAENSLWELQNVQNIGMKTGILSNTTNPGIYKIMGLDTSILEFGSYSLIVRISKSNYIERQSAISLMINKIIPQLDKNLADTIFAEPKGNSIIISFKITDPLNNGYITDADVEISFKGESFPIECNLTSNEYIYELITDSYDVLASAETFVAIITIEINENYTISEIPITVQIQPPLGPLNVPLIYWIIIASVSIAAVALFSTVRIVSYSKIPLLVKQINLTSKKIKKDRKFRLPKITEDRDELFQNKYNERFRILNLSWKGKISELKEDKFEDVSKFD